MPIEKQNHHRFSAFWLRSRAVSVLTSLTQVKRKHVMKGEGRNSVKVLFKNLETYDFSFMCEEKCIAFTVKR